MRPPARREAPSLFGEARHLFGVVHSPVRRSAPSVRRERLSQTQCRNGCEIKKKCELVAAKRIENLIYTRAVLRCNAPGQQQLRHSVPGQQQLPDGAQPRRLGQQRPVSNISAATAPWQASSRWRSVTAPWQAKAPLRLHASNNSATVPRLATNLIRRRKVLRFG